MLKNLYIVRHGETEFNRLGMAQGRGVDSELNETGQKQAKAFFEYYQHLPIEKVYLSTLKRTEQTIKHFLNIGIPYERHEGLDEISWGIHEGKPFSEATHQEYLYYTNQWRLGNTHVAIENAETPEQVVDRQKEITKIILESSEKNILICSHGRAMRILLSWWLGYPLSYMDYFEHHNTSLYHLQYTGSMFKIVRHNDRKHLNNL